MKRKRVEGKVNDRSICVWVLPVSCKAVTSNYKPDSL